MTAEISNFIEFHCSTPVVQYETLRINSRGGHSCVAAAHKLIIFGGHYYGGGNRFEYLNDTWVFDLIQLKWHLKKCNGEAPEPRYGHISELIGSRMFIMGGKGCNSKLFRDTWFLDIENWTWYPVHSFTPGPSPRVGHASSQMGHSIIMHGGWNGKFNCYDDLWIFDSESFKWTCHLTTGIFPCARYGHQLALLEGKQILCFGGATVEKANPLPIYHNDFCQLDIETMMWHKPRIQGVIPSKRYGHTMNAYGHSDICIYGGWGINGIQGNSGDITKSCLLVMDVESGNIRKPVVDIHELPVRHGHSSAIIGKKLFIFGGWDSQQAIGNIIKIESL